MHESESVTPHQMVEILAKNGFDRTEDIIHVFAGGSAQHGAKLPGKGDLDIFGVYIEPLDKVLGLGRDEHFTGGTADQYERNEAGDQDYKLYSLRRWAGLAAKGNPTILGFMFGPAGIPNTVWETNILPNKQLFLAASHATQFLGYAKGQYHRMFSGGARGKHGQRPELEAQFGYDVKAAMHLIRLMYEGIELLTSGTITYPRPEKDVLLQIRRGEWSQLKVENTYLQLESELKAAEKTSSLPPSVDRSAISKLLVNAYLAHWGATGTLQSALLSALDSVSGRWSQLYVGSRLQDQSADVPDLSRGRGSES